MKTISITPINNLVKESNVGAFLPAEESVTCASSALVALQILDASMAPELRPGHVVVIDRTARLTVGALVLVETNDQMLIRCWQPIDNDRVSLVPSNPLWKTLVGKKSELQVKGIVVQRTGRRRADRKRYC